MIRTPIAILLAAALASVAAAVAGAPPLRAQVDGPNLPEVRPVTLDPSTTALLVLDLSTRCDDPQQVCRELVPRIRDFLPRVRGANIFTVFTVSASARGTSLGETSGGFVRRPDEPVIYPDGYDKFVDGELHSLLQERGIATVIITGSSSNISVLYTATTAARIHSYRVVIPVDGINAARSYEHEYTLHQLASFGVSTNFTFTTLDMVEFARS